MTKITNEKCISCLACVSACPYGSIKQEGLIISVATQVKCKSCEKKFCKIMCPTGAITVD